MELGVDPSFMQAVVYQDPRTVVDGIEYVCYVREMRSMVLTPGINERFLLGAQHVRWPIRQGCVDGVVLGQ